MSAPKVVTLPAIFAKAETLNDNSVKLIFASRDLAGAYTAQLFSMKGKECWLLVAPSEDAIDTAVVPNVKPDASVNQKTPGQRMRAVLFVYWSQLGKPGDFDDFYRAKLEYLIDQYKAKLDGGEIRT